MSLTKNQLEPVVMSEFRSMEMHDPTDVIRVDDSGEDLRIQYFSRRFSIPGEGFTTYIFRIGKVTGERWFDGINVSTPHQGNGYGSQMVHAMESICKAAGVKRLRTFRHLEGSEGFWTALGYRLTHGEYEKTL